MYQNIRANGDAPIRAAPLFDVVQKALRLCQPMHYNIPLRASVGEIAALSDTAQQVQERYTEWWAKKTNVAPGEYADLFGKMDYIMAGIATMRPTWSDLPEPYCFSQDAADAMTMRVDEMAVNSLLYGALAVARLDNAITALQAGNAEEVAKQLAIAAQLMVSAEGYRWANIRPPRAEPTTPREPEPHKAGSESADVSKHSRDGGLARSAKYAPLREWVFERYNEKSWSSARQAAKTIAPSALARSSELGCTLSVDRAFQTVYEWIRAAPKPAA